MSGDEGDSDYLIAMSPTPMLIRCPGSTTAVMREALVEAIQGLPEREQYVMSMYYEHDMNLEIAAVLGVTESRVCQSRQPVDRPAEAPLAWSGFGAPPSSALAGKLRCGKAVAMVGVLMPTRPLNPASDGPADAAGVVREGRGPAHRRPVSNIGRDAAETRGDRGCQA